jgi:hypothetical protein
MAEPLARAGDYLADVAFPAFLPPYGIARSNTVT